MTAAALTRQRSYLRGPGRLLLAPAILLLIAASIAPLLVTIKFSFADYRLLFPDSSGFVGTANYAHLVSSPEFVPALVNTLGLIAVVLVASIVGGLLLALLLDGPVAGRGALRLLVISPFFVMPPVSALLWKNLLMQPVSGSFAWLAGVFGLPAFDWFSHAPLLSIALIVAWQWLPFAALILLTSLQSFSHELREAAQLDGASSFAILRHLVLPHLARPIAIVVMIETIFLIGIFAEILVTTGGGSASTDIAFLVYSQAMLQYDVGAASAAGLIAVIFANILAIFLIRAVGRSLEA